MPKLQALARSVDPDLVLDRPGPATLVLTGAYVLLDTVSDVAGGLAVLAMVLAMAGLFGVLSHLVSGRTREMGVRLALGAEPARLRWLILRDGLSPVAGGLVMGLLIGLLVRQGLSAAYSTPLSTVRCDRVRAGAAADSGFRHRRLLLAGPPRIARGSERRAPRAVEFACPSQ